MKKIYAAAGMLAMLTVAAPIVQDNPLGAFLNEVSCTMEVQAAELTQSARWVGEGNTWRVSDNNGSYLKNCWFQDDITGQWYLLGAGDDNTIMFSGLVTDQSTGKTYLLNTEHDGAYGRMLTASGTYTVNGKKIYIEFNQNHDGAFGAITSGLDAVRSTGVEEKQLPSIPSDSQSTPSAKPSWEGKSIYEMTEEERDAKYFGGSGTNGFTGEEIRLKN